MSDQFTPLDRRAMLKLAAGGAVVGTAFAAGIVTSAAGAVPAATPGADSPRPVRQFRAMWLASVVNIDWPSRTGLGAEAQRAEFEAWLDLAQQLNLNAVICQVRPTADAFWPSPHEPWSRYLTGTQGGDPGYDVLAYQLEAAHARNLEYHAWFNPYRVSMQTNGADLLPTHPAKQHPDWVWAYGGKLYYDPGIPEVRAFVEDAMMHAVVNYDIDAVHFDDYFYPYPSGGLDYPDAHTYATHGGGVPIGDWRRANINALVREMRERIQQVKPWVKFGISPFGIWRNKRTDPRGSDTGGTESYSAISADTWTWVKEGWVDYINPQIYWQIGLTVADYAKLVPWWASVVEGTDVALYIGQAVYKHTSGVFTNPREMADHLEFNKAYPQVDGDVFFSAKDVRRDAAGAITTMAAEHYQSPAIVPVIEHLGGQAPQAPVGVSTERLESGVLQVRWNNLPGSIATSFAVWRVSGPGYAAAELEDARNLLTTVRAVPGVRQQVEFALDSVPEQGWYVVTGYDRLWHQSAPSRAAKG
ncbi:glycoside hydrolase family 10 protein [Propionibacteriaceae bacterium G57]|uniref:glycoside hydrolase family 10 protein n=1 Tax=Aestuariimicrobium sp. G57 TaxID=3418485 RepID=UPI003DA74F85